MDWRSRMARGRLVDINAANYAATTNCRAALADNAAQSLRSGNRRRLVARRPIPLIRLFRNNGNVNRAM